eukprot:2097774-Rhodomonas_salina.1
MTLGLDVAATTCTRHVRGCVSNGRQQRTSATNSKAREGECRGGRRGEQRERTRGGEEREAVGLWCWCWRSV